MRFNMKGEQSQSKHPIAVVPPAPLVADPLAMFSVMGRVVQAYAELPGLLVQCRSPFDVWREQVRFVQRIFA
jgi:hypothetical protein